jgi:molybdate transport system substrate-binding protein
VLLQQIAKGAPVDVFASADQETMDAAQKQGLVLPADRQDFASNSLVLIVPHDSKLGIKALADLTQPGVTAWPSAIRPACRSAAIRKGR